MAEKKPFFLTGANAKIKLNGKTIAFATDISYRVDVKHASPRVLGRFEVEVHQPLTYDVSGSFTIIKYTRELTDILGGTPPNNASPDGNGVGSWGVHSGVGGAIAGALGLPTLDGQFDGRADDAFNPGRLFQSKQFTIEIFQKINQSTPGGTPLIPELLVNAFEFAFGSSSDEVVPVVRLEDCRLTASEFVMTKKDVARQRFDFVCRYASEDTFIARKSGVGQELT